MRTTRASAATTTSIPTSIRRSVSFAKGDKLRVIKEYQPHPKLSPQTKLFLKKAGLIIAAVVIGVLIGAPIGAGLALALLALTDIIGFTCASLAISLLSAICLALTFSNKTLSKWANQPLDDDSSFSLKFIQTIFTSGFFAFLFPISEVIYLGPSLVGQFLSGALAGTVIIAAVAAIIGSVSYIKTNAPFLTTAAPQATAASQGAVLSPARLSSPVPAKAADSTNQKPEESKESSDQRDPEDEGRRTYPSTS